MWREHARLVLPLRTREPGDGAEDEDEDEADEEAPASALVSHSFSLRRGREEYPFAIVLEIYSSIVMC